MHPALAEILAIVAEITVAELVAEQDDQDAEDRQPVEDEE